jgi:hypothetical protein
VDGVVHDARQEFRLTQIDLCWTVRLPVHLSRFDLTRLRLVDVTPHPCFSRLNRAHEGMMEVVKVLGGVLVL